MVKIQDGCDNACSYCIVYVLRGSQRSRPRQEILSEVATLAERGYHEVVLTGVHIGAYGRDTGDSLVGLVNAILSSTCPDRLRLSSIEPWDLPRSFFTLWRDPRVCRHLHLPLQSGCDKTLCRMNRHYTTSEYARLVQRARDCVPGLAITTDLIAGFPGETLDEFAVSAEFVSQMGFARVHVFPYSERPGTLAATMPSQVDVSVRRDRARRLRAVSRQSGWAFRLRFVGQTLPVLWEGQGADGVWSGLTDNYIRVFTRSSAELSGQLLQTKLCRAVAGAMWGELV
jgi:threonylcarbamoyladenosine tRNA methylthiotransferase MtaB